MKLIIENNLHEDLKPFILDVVVPTTTQILYSIIDFEQLDRFDKYLQQRYNSSINTKHIITSALTNLVIYNYNDRYELAINPNIFTPGIDAKLYDICALINYGNLDVAPYPIFDKTMEKLALFVPELYDEYTCGE